MYKVNLTKEDVKLLKSKGYKELVSLNGCLVTKKTYNLLNNVLVSFKRKNNQNTFGV